MSDGKLISDEYRDQNAKLHATNRKYGANGHAWRDRVLALIRKLAAKSWLDYGCGKGQLVDTVRNSMRAEVKMGNFVISKYDPVTAPEMPKPAEFVTCCDVLEHIEPDLLDNVLGHIRSVTKTQALLVISLRASNKKLPDGRNAHLIIKPKNWWLSKLSDHFDEVQVVDPIKPAWSEKELAVLVQ